MQLGYSRHFRRHWKTSTLCITSNMAPPHLLFCIWYSTHNFFLIIVDLDSVVNMIKTHNKAFMVKFLRVATLCDERTHQYLDACNIYITLQQRDEECFRNSRASMRSDVTYAYRSIIISMLMNDLFVRKSQHVFCNKHRALHMRCWFAISKYQESKNVQTSWIRTWL